MSRQAGLAEGAAAYRFTNDWFDIARPVWSELIPRLNPSRMLEIGSYEGASTCFLIDTLAASRPIEIHCVDTWEGGVEHQQAAVDMAGVEARFGHNTALAMRSARHRTDLVVHKGRSDVQLAQLLVEGRQGYFDFVYVDGSHQAPDVLCDAVLGFRLLRRGGLIVFDDYLWSEAPAQAMDPIRCPKPAIDAFTNIHCRKIRILATPLYQLHVLKLAD